MPQTIILISKNKEYIKQLYASLSGTAQYFTHYDTIDDIQKVDPAIVLYDADINESDAVIKIQSKLSKKTPVIGINNAVQNMSMQITSPLDISTITNILAKFAHNQSDREPTSHRDWQKLEDKKTDVNLWFMLQNFSNQSLHIIIEQLQIRDNKFQDIDWNFILPQLRRKLFIKPLYDTVSWTTIISQSSTKNITCLWKYLSTFIIDQDGSRINRTLSDLDMLLQNSIKKGLNLEQLGASSKMDKYWDLVLAGFAAKYQTATLFDTWLKLETEFITNNPKKLPTIYHDAYWKKLQHLITYLNDHTIRNKFENWALDNFSTTETPAVPWSLITSWNIEKTSPKNNTILQMLEKNKTGINNLPENFINWAVSSNTSLSTKYKVLNHMLYNPEYAKLKNLNEKYFLNKMLSFIATNDTVKNRLAFYKNSALPKKPYNLVSNIITSLFPEYLEKCNAFDSLLDYTSIKSPDEYLNILEQIIHPQLIQNNTTLPEFEL